MGNYYAGEYRSAIARAKRILLAAGFQWSVTTGRYQPFANTQVTTRGVRVTRVGCSDTVALHIWGDTLTSDAARQRRREMMASALETLRAAGMPFDDRGWLECGRKARKAVDAEATRTSAATQEQTQAVSALLSKALRDA